jgi:predicted transcriptional regulator
MKKARPFGKLRGKLTEMDIDQMYLAEKIGLSDVTISLRMTGKREWLLSEMYAVLDLINETEEKLHEYFPKDGGITAERKRAS